MVELKKNNNSKSTWLLIIIPVCHNWNNSIKTLLNLTTLIQLKNVIINERNRTQPTLIWNVSMNVAISATHDPI